MLRSRPVEKLILHTSFIATGNRAGGGCIICREREVLLQSGFICKFFVQNVDSAFHHVRVPVREGRGGSHLARLNFKTSRVGVYKRLSLIVGFAVTVPTWPREVVSCCDFILRAVATFWAMSLVGIYPGRASCAR